MHLFEDFVIKAAFGFAIFIALVLVIGFLTLLYTEMGVYLFWLLLGIVIFYLLGHWLHENI